MALGPGMDTSGKAYKCTDCDWLDSLSQEMGHGDMYTTVTWGLKVELKGQMEAEPDPVQQQAKATGKLNVMGKPKLSRRHIIKFTE